MGTIEILRERGIARIEPLTSGEIADVTAHLDNCAVAKAHVWNKSTEYATGPAAAYKANWPVCTTTMRDVVTAPHLLEAALETLPLAREYFGEEPLLYSMNAFWTFPSHETYLDTHEFHRDGDDRKQLVLFIYGSDIKQPQDGAHLYKAGTHIEKNDALAPQSYDCILGDAGTSFVSDTSGLHMGLRPRRPRLILWARWGVSDPPESYRWDALSPVPRAEIGQRYPTDPSLQSAIHLVVA